MFQFLTGINWSAIGLSFMIAFASGWTVNGWRLGEKLKDVQAQYVKASEKAKDENRAKELKFQRDVDSLRSQKDEQIRTVNSRLSVALDELRKRPSRSSVQAATTQDGPSCPGGTGAQLYREDAEFLAREAARAEVIRVSLESCYKQYEEIAK
jgi:hypothetical protein